MRAARAAFGAGGSVIVASSVSARVIAYAASIRAALPPAGRGAALTGREGMARASGDGQAAPRIRPDPAAIDPVTLAVLDNRLRAIVEEMGEAMLRSSYSQILNSSRDFSIALVRRAVPAGGAGGPHPGPCRRHALGGARRGRGLSRRAARATPSCSTTPTTAAATSRTSPSSCRSSPKARSASGRWCGRTRATSAAPRTAATTRAPPRSGRKASACRRSAWARTARCARTSCGCWRPTPA